MYFLLCGEDGERSVYIGEAESVHEHLKQHILSYQHNKEPCYWTQAIAFVGADLNKAPSFKKNGSCDKRWVSQLHY